MTNKAPCPCCGQLMPFPTEPGIWEFNESPNCLRYWVRVEVKLPEANDPDGIDGLRLWKDGKKIWWPKGGEWRKVDE